MKKSIGERSFQAVNAVFMIFLIAVTIYPYANQLAVSLNDGNDSALGGITIYPRIFTWMNYATILSNGDFKNSIVISVIRVLSGSAFGLAVTTGAAFALTKKSLPGRNWMITFLIVPMFISGGLIPTYMLYREMGLINNFLVHVLPGAFSFFNMILIRTFLQTIPASMEESAIIDGANDFQILTKILIPLSMPVMATVVLWLAVGNWNDWLSSLYFITKKQLYAVQYVLYRVVKEAELINQMKVEMAKLGQSGSTNNEPGITSQSVKAATVMVSTLPIVIVYPFLQKYFVKGVMIGAIKE